MIKSIVSVALILFVATSMSAAGPQASDGSLHFLSITVDQQGIGKHNNELDQFDWCGVNLVRLFNDHSADLFKHISTTTLAGAEGTKPRFIASLNHERNALSPNDLFILYIGMHGGTDRKEGWATGLADGKEITGREVKEILAGFPCQCICLVETCGSGGFARTHKDDIPLPPNVTALCCCKSQQTAGNQLDITVEEALHGRADFNHDGVVQLSEMIRYVKLRYEATFAKDGADSVIVPAKDPTELPLTKVTADMVAICHDGEWYSGTLVSGEKNKYKVRCDGFDTEHPKNPWFLVNMVTRDQIVLPGEADPLIVEQNGTWYAARLLSMQGKQFHVKYVGYDEEETVDAGRVKRPIFVDPQAKPGK